MIRTGSFLRRRLPQVPHLITRNQNQRIPLASHKFVVQRSQQDMLKQPRQQVPHVMPPLPEADQAARPRTGAFDKDDEMDRFLTDLANNAWPAAIEEFFKRFYGARDCIVWIEIPDMQMLYCPKLKLTAAHTQGLIGYAFFSRESLRASDAWAHPSFNKTVDGVVIPKGAAVLAVPLWDSRNSLCAVVEVVRDAEFIDDECGFATWFTKRFRKLSAWVMKEQPLDQLVLDLTPLKTNEECVPIMMGTLRTFFDCEAAEVWKYDRQKEQVTRYGRSDTMKIEECGIVGEVLTKEMALNIACGKLHASYRATVDGAGDKAVLAVPVADRETQNVFAVVLRGPQKEKVFTKAAQDQVRRISPIVLQSLANAELYSAVDDEFRDSTNEREGLAVLLEVVEVISSQLDTNRLVELIMEKGRLLTNADRCSLFLVNESRDRLKTSLHKGLENAIDIPIDKGIAGKTVTEGQIFNIADAYETDFFDSTIDRESGYRTMSVLSVPIYNSRGEIIGVTEMVNKKGGAVFTSWDTKLIQIFNVFCGISLENARLYRDSVDMSNQLRSFFDISFTLAKSESLQRLLSDIMTNAKTTIDADRASLFLYDENANELSTFIADGMEKMPNTLPVDAGITGMVLKSKEGLFVNDVYTHPQFNKAIDAMTGYKTKSVLCVPIISAEHKLLGLVEMVNKKNGEFVKRDIQMLTAFATFASVGLENSRLRDIAELGDEEIEMVKWISTAEREEKTIPAKLVLTQDEIDQVNSRSFFSVNFKGIGHFKELWYIFNKFHIFETFSITNEMFFRFIFSISSTYNQVPYHNWTHACDVVQYVAYEISTASIDKILTSLELFAMLMACVCHDANHEGFNNVFNVKAETPLGILFKDSSVMEMHHLTVSIPIVAREDINMFKALNHDEVKKVWTLFIGLILATDMAKHFELVKRAQALLDENAWDLTNDDNRFLAMQLLLKVADISNVSRPFELADKWCDILNNEFFRQGDLEKETGIGLTSPLNDRDNSDKPKSQIGFYNFICLPLYQVLARKFPELQVNFDAVKSNLEKWKELAAANAPPPSS